MPISNAKRTQAISSGNRLVQCRAERAVVGAGVEGAARWLLRECLSLDD